MDSGSSSKGKGFMFDKLKLYLRRYKFYPVLVAAYQSMRWKQHILSDWRDTYILRARREVLTPFGFKLLAGNYVANRAMQEGEFEVEEIAIIQQNLSHAQVFVDVGANIGLYTCLARSVGRYAIAIEPQPQNLDCLYANLSANGWTDTEVYPLGLSDQIGLVNLYGASGPSASLISGWAGYSKRFRQTIPVTTLDVLLGERFIGRKLLIKIDVEGAEYNVLRGAQKTMSMLPHPTWMIEICLSEYHPAGINPNYAATFEMFWQHGYEARTADGRSRVVRPTDVERWVNARRCDLRAINYIFMPTA